MALSPGTMLGPYEIQAPLGAGGMGEVYRARDTRLDRTVAIKVLPLELARDASRRQRLEREAKAISQLSHPHICTLYDVGREEETDFLVMEYLEGETLAHRLEKGPLPLEQALRTAAEIADALDKAHRQGVVHRDLKPGNVMLTKSGAKLLDFGLAKLREVGSAEDGVAASALPTEAKPLTEEGRIVGTYPYMAPEQLEGGTVDARTDLFAFGAVLYEMVTGQRAFEGKSRASLIAAILEHDPPPVSALQPLSPGGLDHVVTACLAKDPDDRWQSAQDVRVELEWIAAAGSQAGEASPSGTRPGARARLAWGATGVLLGIALAALAVWSLRPSATTPGVVRLRMGVQPAEQLGGARWRDRLDRVGQRPSRTELVLSPDGTQLVFSGGKNGQWQLYLRRLDEKEALPIPGTNGAISPFLSPDGRWLGYWTPTGNEFNEQDDQEGELRKLPLAGGLPVTLCETTSPFGASWGSNGSIVFAQRRGGLWRVSAEGGTPEELTTLEEGEISHRLPQVLPGGEAVLFTSVKRVYSWNDAEVEALVLATGERRVLVAEGADARYAPTGHLLFVRLGTLMAMPFDLARLVATGSATPIVDEVMQAINSPSEFNDTGAAQLGVSGSGTLVYLTGGVYPDSNKSLVWVDRKGAVQPLAAPAGPYYVPRLSPSGQRVAVDVSRVNEKSLWVFDIRRGTFSSWPLAGPGLFPVWTPDGRRVAFSSFAGETTALSWLATDGGGDVRGLATTENAFPCCWSPDGRELAYVEFDPGSNGDIWVLRLGEDAHETRPILQTPFQEQDPAFSPDGRWLAYASNETGRTEVYVQPYPGPGTKTQISTRGGEAPAWARNGRELLFLRAKEETPGRFTPEMMAVDITTEPVFAAGIPRRLFEGHYSTVLPCRAYDVTPDGQRFLMLQRPEPSLEQVTEIHVVLNWFEELKRRAPTE